MNEPTIGEQIEWATNEWGDSRYPHERAILASLERLQRLDAQTAPVEPKPFGYLCEWDSLNQAFYYGEPGSGSADDWNEFPKVHHNLPLYSKDTIDSLQSALQRAQEELRTDWYLQAKRSDEMAMAWEREARELKERNRRMVELLKEPSGAMVAAGQKEGNEQASHGQHCCDVFVAMSAELLKEVGK